MQLEIILLTVGIIGLWFGAGLVIDHSIRIAKKLNITETFIGLTILSIGTSLPEITTSIVTSLDVLNGLDVSGIAVGTSVGSNIIQITLVMGVIGLLRKVKTDEKIMNHDVIVMLSAILLFFFAASDKIITNIEGALMATGYIIYLLILSKEEKIFEKKPKLNKNIVKEVMMLCIGFTILIYAGNVTVNNAEKISNIFNLSGSFIGSMIIGVGTALPEFTTAIRGLAKKSTGISLGVLIGSSITNPMFALGIGAAISSYKIGNQLLVFDIPFWFIASIIAVSFFRKSKKLSKPQAISLILAYIIYASIKIYNIT